VYHPFISSLTGLPLDSANWDIRDGEDRNLYTYDEHLNLYRNERFTGSLHELDEYNVDGDSTWWWSENVAEEFRNPMVLEDSVLNYVVYTEDRIKMQLFDKWDPDLTQYEIYYNGDSAYYFSTYFSNYTHTQDTSELAYVFRDNQLFFKSPYDTTTAFGCQDSPEECLCIPEESDTIRIQRTIHADVVADTMFVGAQATNSWYFPNDERFIALPIIPAMKQNASPPISHRSVLFLDLMGRRQDKSRRNYPLIQVP